MNASKERKPNVLADKEYIHCAQIKLVEEGKSCEAFFGGMHTGIQLFRC